MWCSKATTFLHDTTTIHMSADGAPARLCRKERQQQQDAQTRLPLKYPQQQQQQPSQQQALLTVRCVLQGRWPQQQQTVTLDQRTHPFHILD